MVPDDAGPLLAGPKKVAAVQKAFQLVQVIERNADHGLGVSELARRTDLPKSTAFRLLHTLEAEGAVVSVEGHYRLGPTVADTLSIPDTPVVDRVQSVVTPFLAALFERTRLTVHLATVVTGEVVILNKLHGITRVPSPTRIGGRVPAHCTSLGKAILAFDPQMLGRIGTSELQRWTDRTITDPEELRTHLMRTRRTRIGRDDGEYVDVVGSVGSVVFGTEGEPVASLAVTGLRDQVRSGRFDAILLEVCAAASGAYRVSMGRSRI